LATCHECLIDKNESTEDKIVYQGQSPDEVTLVDAAKELGYVFKGNRHNVISLDIRGKEHQLEFL
jgi:magnesium-transporting ATPase (P-type)